jgi:hypothetical protein
LCGDEDKLIANSDSWHELLAGKVLYMEPAVSKYDVRYLLANCLQHYPQLTELDNILIAVVELNAVQVMYIPVVILDT